jgi:DNA polymerase I-like protein with 3'-5' exonuclease and polymerase domains
MAGATWNIEIPTAEYVDRDYPRLEQLINEVRAQPRIALDTETTGLNTWKDMPLFWSLAWPGRRMTLHASVMPLFQEAFDDPRKYWYFANAKFDLHMTANYGCPIQGHVVDVQVMHALLHDDRPHALKSIAEEVKGWRWSDFKDTFRPRPGFTYQDAMMEMFHADRGRLVEYAANDAYATFEIGMELDRQLHRERTYSLYPDLYPTLGEVFWRTEMPFTRVLWKMERKGIKLDFERAERTKEPISQRMAEIEKRVAQLKGASFNLGSRPDLIQALVVEEGLRPLSYTKGGKSGKRTPSLDEEFFKAYRNTSELASLKYEYDSIRKVKSTFIDGLLKFADPNQRVHTSYKQDTARCMPAGELVLTSRGYIPVETVLVGDTVITHTGQRRKVTETSTHAPKPIYTVTTSNGLRLRTTGNHEYRTKDSWIRADQLVSGTPLEAHSDAEEWRTIAGWSPFQVSSWGRVRNASTGKIRTLSPKGKWGHLKVCLSRNGAQARGKDRKDFSVHRLVIRAFGSKRKGEVRHLNGVAWDNTIRNLKIGTTQENRGDALRHGSLSQRRAGRTKLSEEQVAEIREAGRPAQPPPKNARLNFEIAEEIRSHTTRSRPWLAKKYDVTYQTVDNILKGKTWTKERVHGKIEDLARKYMVSKGTIRDIQSGRRWPDESYITGSKVEFFEVHVVHVEEGPPEVTYGLTVEEDHSHVTGGIVTHNTGRLSSKEPALQVIPNADNDEYALRKMFVAGKGKDLICRDYNALEMRLLACASMEPGMIQVFSRGWDIHMGNAAMVFDLNYDDIAAAKAKKDSKQPLTDVEKKLLKLRGDIKVVGFGGPSVQAELKLPQNGEPYGLAA